MFFVAEFLHAFTVSALTAVLFLGGWQGPGAVSFPILGLLYFMLKTSVVYFVLIWIRATLPRIRIDQMNTLNWKFITPLALASLITTAVMEKLAVQMGFSRFGLHTAGNLVLLALTFFILRAYARSRRRLTEANASGRAKAVQTP
jgi:NADH-quinone oxidoreductase subunit H